VWRPARCGLRGGPHASVPRAPSPSSVGSVLPRFDARRRMPAAARADRKNLGGAVGSKTCASTEGDDEHSPSALRHSEVASVENPVGPPIPEFAQATEERPKILASMTGEEARYVLEDDGGRSVALHKVEEGVGEVGAGACDHASSLAGDAEILAGEAAGPEGGVHPIACAPVPSSVYAIPSSDRPAPFALLCAFSKANDVTEVRDSGPSLGEDGGGVGVDLGEGDGSPSGTLQPKVKSPDPREEEACVSAPTAAPTSPAASGTPSSQGGAVAALRVGAAGRAVPRQRRRPSPRLRGGHAVSSVTLP
jgi:hypothetical protein